MKLLIFTQKVDTNDDVLGFFHFWIAEFARQCERVTVVCLFEGEHHLPDNVRVLSLGKEELAKNKNFQSFFVKWQYLYRFYKYIWHFRKDYDRIFVHMNPVYAVLGGFYWRFTGKKIGLWYAHGHVPFVLRLAEKFVDVIFTSTPEGFRLPSRKVMVVGQGIRYDADPRMNENDVDSGSNHPETGKILLPVGITKKIVTVGRISPVKNYETLISAVKILRDRDGIEAGVEIVGGVGLAEHEAYLGELKKMAIDSGLEDVVRFVGPVPADKVAGYLGGADAFVNTSLTGSLDKVILEAMAAGLPALTCNEAAAEVIGEYGGKLMFRKESAEDLADKLRDLFESDRNEVRNMTKVLRERILSEHSLQNLIRKILIGY